jgi:hypothetical protein
VNLRQSIEALIRDYDGDEPTPEGFRDLMRDLRNTLVDCRDNEPRPGGGSRYTAPMASVSEETNAVSNEREARATPQETSDESGRPRGSDVRGDRVSHRGPGGVGGRASAVACPSEARATGDSYARREVSARRYQCGCYWDWTEHGDTLFECTIHAQATAASVAKTDRQRTDKAIHVPKTGEQTFWYEAGLEAGLARPCACEGVLRSETALPPIEPGELPAFGLIQAWVKRLGLSASLYNQRLLAHDLTDLFGASRPETTAEQELYDEAYRLAWNSARHACITACIGALTGSEAREQIESMVNKLPTPTGSEGT